MTLLRANSVAIPLAADSVDLIITSPPYFALRSYTDDGEHYSGQIGSEPTPEDFLEALWTVTDECWRVLKPSGSLWVNLGDKYAGSGGHNNSNLPGNTTRSKATPTARRRQAPDRYNQASGGVRDKSLMGLPWRYALGCINPDGYRPRTAPECWHETPCFACRPPASPQWVGRAEVIWSKPNGLPESVADRVRRSHEQWFHLTKAGRYYAGIDEIREAHASPQFTAREDGTEHHGRATEAAEGHHRYDVRTNNPLGKLPGSVWTIPSEPLKVPEWLEVDHFAAYPQEWPRRIILGWSPSGICNACGEGRRPDVEQLDAAPRVNAAQQQAERGWSDGDPSKRTLGVPAADRQRSIAGYRCACPAPTMSTRPAIVLDPFGGTGTTAMVARALGRYPIHLDLSADYLRLARWRVFQSGHANKTHARTNAERQGTLL